METPNIQAGMGRKSIWCLRCHQMGHYASECPNPGFMEDYAPLYANYKQPGHQHYQYNAPFNSNKTCQQMQSSMQINEENNKESRVNRIEVVQAVTRNQAKKKGTNSDIGKSSTRSTVSIDGRNQYLNTNIK